MKRLALLPLVMTLAYCCCGKEENLTAIRFPLCDLYLIYKLEYDFNDPSAYWSPDGGKIVFMDSSFELWFISPQGGKPTIITDTRTDTTRADYGARHFHPNWCPTAGSNKIVFIRNRAPGDFNYTICTMDLNEGEPTPVKFFEEKVAYTSWSHDGEKIVFIKTEGAEYGKGIFTIPAVGGEATVIPNSQSWRNSAIVSAQASPSRNVVIYVDQQNDAIFRLKSIDIEGGQPTTIMSFPAGMFFGEFSISESNDGSMIAVCARYSRNRNIFLVPSTGGEMIHLTEFNDEEANSDQGARHASWSPDGDEMVVSLYNRGTATSSYPTGVYRAELKL